MRFLPADGLPVNRLLIVQPYIPAYRVPLFRSMRPLLAQSGIELVLAVGKPQGAMEARLDDRSYEEADAFLEQRTIRVLGKQVLIRSLQPVIERYSPDLVIVEQAIKNVEAYPLLARQAVGRGPRVAMWGQGRTFSTSQGAAGRGLKDWLTRRTDWFFAYTQEGADYVAAHGYAGERITVLLNSTDTAALRSDLRAVTDEQLAQFRYRHNLLPGATALFLGGVDESKGINFLIEAARRVAQQIPGFRLLIGGEGASGGWVRERQAAGDPVIALGRIDGHERALALSSADLMMVPQWVGLVAVDSLAAGVPIVTTWHGSHSPEFSYLTDGVNAAVTEHDLDEYATSIVALIGDPARRTALADRARIDSTSYSVEEMAKRFTEGVRRWQHSAGIEVNGITL